MNLGSHIAVAANLYPTQPLIWLGAALPDLAAIGRFRLLGSTTSEQLTLGISLHHKTDEVFHKSPWFTSRQRLLTDRLTQAEVPRGACKAVAHVGPELLLDGALAQQTNLNDLTSEALSEIPNHLQSLLELVTRDEQRWSHHLELIQRRGAPQDYHDPALVAERLQRILSSRPRLALDASYTSIVAFNLSRMWPGITETASDFVEQVASKVAEAAATQP